MNNRTETGMDIPQSLLQSPFRQSTLLTVSRFTNYCDRNNLRTNEKELEKLHREGILYPSARVHLGIEEWSKIFAHHHGKDQWIFVPPNATDEFKPTEIDPKVYYRTSPLWMSGENWMSDWYKDNVDFPSTLPHFPWKGRNHLDFTPEKDLVSHDYELLYDERQFLALKIIRTFADTHRPEEDYKDALLKRLSELYRFIRLYIDAEILYERYQKHRRETFQKFFEELKDLTEARREWRSNYRLNEEPRLQEHARIILKTHGLTIQELDNWRFFLSQQSIFNDGSVSRKSPSVYIRELDDDALMEAEDTNKMIFVLNQFLFLLTGEERTVKSIVGHYDDPRCTICHKCFIPEPHVPTQVTCGSAECLKVWRREYKKQKAKEEKEAKQN